MLVLLTCCLPPLMFDWRTKALKRLLDMPKDLESWMTLLLALTALIYCYAWPPASMLPWLTNECIGAAVTVSALCVSSNRFASFSSSEPPSSYSRATYGLALADPFFLRLREPIIPIDSKD